MSQPNPQPQRGSIILPVASPVNASPSPVNAGQAVPVQIHSRSQSLIQPQSQAQPRADETVEAKLILELPNTKIYLIQNAQKALIEQGTVQVLSSNLEQGQGEVYLIVLGRFRLALSENLPCLVMAQHNYVFPSNDACYGVVLDSNVDAEAVDVFDILLESHTALQQAQMPATLEEIKEREDRLARLALQTAEGIEGGSSRLAGTVIEAGRKMGQYVQSGSMYLKNRLTPHDPLAPVSVSPSFQRRVNAAKMASGVAVTISKAVVLGAMSAISMFGSTVGDSISATSLGAAIQRKGGVRTEAVKHVGKTTFGAVAKLYEALELAGLVLLRDVTDATVQVVTHKYGPEVGRTTHTGLGVVTDVTIATSQMRSVGVKAILKKTAKESAIQSLADEEERKLRRANAPQFDPAVAMQALAAVSSLVPARSAGDNPAINISPARVQAAAQSLLEAAGPDEDAVATIEVTSAPGSGSSEVAITATASSSPNAAAALPAVPSSTPVSVSVLNLPLAQVSSSSSSSPGSIPAKSVADMVD